MTEQNQARSLIATLRDALHQLESTLGRMQEGVDAIASQAERIRDSVAALGDLRQREDTSVGIKCSSTLPWMCSRPSENLHLGSSTCRPRWTRWRRRWRTTRTANKPNRWTTLTT